jgi:uncharacterized membrane protein
MIKNLAIFAACLIFLIGNAAAFGVVSENWPGNPLKTYAGAEGEIIFTLQNVGGDGDLTVRATLLNGAGIAILEETEYTVLAGTKDTLAIVSYAIPENAPQGTEYEIMAQFEAIPPDNAGGVVAIGTATQMRVPIQVGEKPLLQQAPAVPYASVFATITTILILIIVIVLLIRRRKRSRVLQSINLM